MTASSLSASSPAMVPSDDYPSAARSAFALATLCLISATLTMDMSLIGLLIEPIKADLHLTDAQLGLVQGPAFSLAYAFCAIPTGMLVDRYPRVRFLWLGMIVWAGAMLMMSFASSFWMLVLGKILIGVAAASLMTAPGSLISDLVPPRLRARATSFLVIGQVSGGAIGFLGGGLIFDALTSHWRGDLSAWRLSFLLFGALGLSLLPLLLGVREPQRRERAQAPLAILASLRELAAYRGLLGPLMAAYALQIIAESSVRIWLPPALMRLYHLTPGQFGGWLGGVGLVGGLLGSVLGGVIAEWARRRGSILPAVIGSIIIALSTTLALMPSTTPLFAIHLGATIAAGVMAIIVSSILITEVPNELRGFATGILILLAVGPGLAIGPVLIPAVSDALGGPLMVGRALAVAGVPIGLISAALYALVRRSPATKET